MKQLGYAAFPWSGLALAALFAAPADDSGSRRSRARALLFGGALFAFALVSSMGTKFHHYGLVVLPGAAMIGRAVARRATRGGLLGPRRRMQSAATQRALVARRRCAARPRGRARSRGALERPRPVGRSALRPAHDVSLRSPLAWRRSVRARPSWRGRHRDGVASIGLAVRAWRAARGPRLRGVRGALRRRLARRLSRSRGARRRTAGRLRGLLPGATRRHGRGAPLVAYQLNWKGENFYSGNNVAIFISSGAPMRTYLDARKRTARAPCTSSPSAVRVDGLRSELGAVRSFEELTGRERVARVQPGARGALSARLLAADRAFVPLERHHP